MSHSSIMYMLLYNNLFNSHQLYNIDITVLTYEIHVILFSQFI